MTQEKKKTEKENKKEKKKKLLVLLDAHAIIHRAYHALPDFSTSKGQPTGALYGIVAMLLKIIKDLKPDYIAATYDLPGPTFRHVAYEKYKAGRPKADEALVAQIIRSKDIFTAFGIPMYEHPGFEADDILGTIVEQLSAKGGSASGGKDIDIIIASGDMDTMQLVDDARVRVYTLKKGINDTILYDEKGVIERFGFPPKLLPDFKGLRGDPSDNIIGISGIGEKTATTLVKEFGTIENLYGVLRRDRKKIIAVGMTERIVNLLSEGEEEALFSKTLALIRRDAPILFAIPKETWIKDASVEKIESLLRELEFKSLAARVRVLFGMVVDDKKSDNEKNDAMAEKVEEIDQTKLTNAGIALWLVDSEKTNPDIEDILEFTKKDNQKKTLGQSLEILKEELVARGLYRVYEEIELPIVPIIKKAEERGILVDAMYFKKLAGVYRGKLKEFEKKIWEYAGEEFNINSPKQMGVILFDKLRLMANIGTRMKKTEGGARSTRISELEKLKDSHPIISEIVNYRELQKLLSTYIDAIPPLLDDNSRLHTHFIQTGTTTGRFSSANPNLQNIPIRSELGRAVRNGFVASEGHLLLSFDYSQIELRVAAILSGDKYLTQIFKEGKDAHNAVAARVFKVPESEVTPEMRRRAKVINFGIVYGMGVTALKDNLGSTRAEAQKFYDDYLREFGELADYLENVKLFAKKNGYTETLFGRRRYFPGIRSSIPFVRAMAERMAINAPLQGTAADIIKIAIKLADDDLGKNKLNPKTHLLLQIHDELIYEAEVGVADFAEKVIKESMEAVFKRSYLNKVPSVPIIVNFSSGRNWGEV
ncbi:MAG: DNA polymerase [Patescibacteria group bacterium]